MSLPVVLALLSLLTASIFYLKSSRTSPLPPGPKPWPVLGNIKDLTAKEFWLPATQWAKQYGDIVYLHVFGQGLVFLNSFDVANELMEKRGAIYSDRAPLVMAGELCGAGHMVAFTRYGPASRRQRRLMALGLSRATVPSYHPLITASTRKFLRTLFAEPGNHLGAVRRYAGGLNLNVVYGLEVTRTDDPYLMKVEGATDLLANEVTAGGGLWLVDIFPFLKHLPDWFPGAGFKRKAAVWKKDIVDSVDYPYDAVKANVRAGTAVPSFCSTLLQQPSLTELDEFDVKWTANSMYAASMDTTITLTQHFLLAMLAYPQHLARAQAELDAVLGPGPGRLPRFEDRPALPFIDAIFAECMRWGVPVPLGLPHRLMEDDVFQGKFIPKGSLVFANIWAMLRDPAVYPDPERFDPERFLTKVDDATARRRDPRAYVFGFGRRRCPGVHLVESSVWLMLASMLATLDIRKPAGAPDPVPVFDNTVFRNPDPFPVELVPRSEQARRLVEEDA
ncbi:cytochrome P450 [Artomyces pyxidatus]|uniref:Cytochrome P450 n=1 Tax=Artomyces pyxidatus TaxID=48021 RepID=A0ACB8SKG3_9AGAM|nr:cytochrome P450 [Artomyces pyxidatus]